MRLEGKRVVVTGAGTGIGRSIAERLAADGAQLTLFARDESRLLRRRPGRATRSLDIRDRAAVLAAFDEPIDALVANAGIGGAERARRRRPLRRHRADEPLRHVLVRRGPPSSACPDGGRIVVTSSILARIGVAGYTAYCASKAGLLGLVRSLAAELAPRRIQVNAICPGWVDTEMAWEGLSDWPGLTADEAWEIAQREVPLRRMSQPDEIAGTVAWLLSDDAIGVTGQAIDQNNGAFMI